MRIRFKNDVLSCPDVWSDLDRIVHRIEDKAHEWDINDPDAMEESGWLRDARSSIRSFFEDAAKKSSYPPVESIHFRQITVTTDPREGELTPRSAANFVHDPLYVLVENKFTDGCFFNAVLRVLAPQSLKKLYFEQKVRDLTEIVGAGGNGELPKHIVDHVEKSKTDGLPLRVVVFTDSDGRFPGHQGEDADRVHDCCRVYGVPCLILSKRAIENYIPDEVLTAWCDTAANKNHRTKVEAIKRLTPEQRDHFPMKSGLQEENRKKKLREEEERLYGSVPPDDRKQLQQGLGGDVIHSLKTHEQALAVECLSSRDYVGQLDSLVQLIVKEL